MSYHHHNFEPARAYRRDDMVEDRVRRFMPMVRRAAWHIYGMGRAGLEVEDLVQAGVVALTECAINHEGPGEDGFAAYAKMRVRGAMFDQIRKLALDSRTTQAKSKQFDEAYSLLKLTLLREPTRSEIALHLGWNDSELREFELSRVQVGSIDEFYDETSAAFAANEPDPFEILSDMNDRDRLIAAMCELPERLQLVLQLFYVEELNLTEIAEVLEVSVPRVHQLRASALSKLREML